MKTKEQALQDASNVLAEVAAIVSKLTPREAAERAWHPGGPSIDELTDLIRESGICRGATEKLRSLFSTQCAPHMSFEALNRARRRRARSTLAALAAPPRTDAAGTVFQLL